MLDDGLLDRFPRPDVCLGQHVDPMPAGHFGLRPGTTMAAADSLLSRLFGQGGHGSIPQSTVDPVAMAAATVLRLQGIVARDVGPTESAMVTVGAMQAGSTANVIPDRAEIQINVRSFDTDIRDRVLSAITRVVRAEAAASNAPRDPEITEVNTFSVDQQ